MLSNDWIHGLILCLASPGLDVYYAFPYGSLLDLEF